MRRIAILGLGNFGTAVAHLWSDEGHSVNAWTVEEEVYESLRRTGVNEKYLPGVTLSGVRPFLDMQACVAGAEVVVLALPSGVILDVVDDLIPFLSDEQILLDLAKGLASDDRMISEDIERKLQAADRKNRLCVLTGPTIATELARKVFTTALLASKDSELAKWIASELSTSTFRLTPAADMLGAEYWGAFKNVIALACGISDGLKEDGRGGDNLKAAIFTAGFRDAVRLLPRLGAAPETAATPAGIGDLYVTASSPFGRNRQMGERLGRGQTLAQAQREMVMVSEGVRAARLFRQRFERIGAHSPFVESVCQLLDGEISIDDFLAAVANPAKLILPNQ